MTLDDALEDLRVGRILRDDGQRIALHASDVRWKAAAERAIAEFASSGVPFTVDDVRARVGSLAASDNALPALFGSASKRGAIRCVGVRNSTRASRRAGLVRVWIGTGGGR